QMLQLRQFDLQLACFRASALRENVQNQRRAIKHLALEGPLQIACLRRRQLIVENDRIDLVPAAMLGKFIGFARADVSACSRGVELLDAFADHLAARRKRKLAQFADRILEFYPAVGLQLNANKK